MAVYGLGGVGKTRIALELAYRTKDKDPTCSVFWVPATTVESVHQAYFRVSQWLQIPGVEEQKDINIKRIVQHYLNRDHTGQWLLIVDNADDIDMMLGSSGQRTSLIDYILRSNKGSIVFTTRSRKTAVRLAGANLTEVAEMDKLQSRF
jgi:hypothetical protein